MFPSADAQRIAPTNIKPANIAALSGEREYFWNAKLGSNRIGNARYTAGVI
jgi:hypothetical protein